jgi:hypothetical protein
METETKTGEQVLALWKKVTELVSATDKDAVKHSTKDNLSAGVRVRAALKELKVLTKELRAATLLHDKEVKKERKTAE